MGPKTKGSTSRTSVPRNWPHEILYLNSPLHSTRLPDEARKAVVLAPSESSKDASVLKLSGPYTNVRITPISDKSHPAHGQYGLFASQHLPPDCFILPYLGYVHDKADTDEGSDYDLSLDREFGIGVDASKMGNEARFINDYRGVSSGPNAEFRDVHVDFGNGRIEKGMGVFVLSVGKSGKRAKGIAKGQEILVSYGKGFWTERQQSQE